MRQQSGPRSVRAQRQMRVPRRRECRLHVHAVAQDEAVLFAANGESSVVSEALNTQVSLSTMLLLAVVAFAAHQLYRWYANKAARDGQIKSLCVCLYMFVFYILKNEANDPRQATYPNNQTNQIT